MRKKRSPGKSLISRFMKRRSHKEGLPPGSLVRVGEAAGEHLRITLFEYDEKHITEKTGLSVEETLGEPKRKGVCWIDVRGLHPVDAMERLGKHFKLHPLVLEDILNSDQRPKVEDFGQYVYLVFRVLTVQDGQPEIKAEQVSLILGEDFVISFLEHPQSAVFDSIRDRIRKNRGLIRQEGADYLAYSLLDSVVDRYFSVLEVLGDQIEDLEEELATNPSRAMLDRLHHLKKEMIFLKKSTWPLRELVASLERGDFKQIQTSTRTYLRDVYDHIIQVIETEDTYREMLSGMLDIYLSGLSNRMNEIMKVLTIIATVFLPITFLAGVYGMNFYFMPELRWRWGYLAAWILMITVVAVMLFYFRKKKWIGK